MQCTLARSYACMLGLTCAACHQKVVWVLLWFGFSVGFDALFISCVCRISFFFFFFSSRRRHTRFDCDWSSDVCSSDLDEALEQAGVRHVEAGGLLQGQHAASAVIEPVEPQHRGLVQGVDLAAPAARGDRKSVV